MSWFSDHNWVWYLTVVCMCDICVIFRYMYHELYIRLHCVDVKNTFIGVLHT